MSEKPRILFVYVGNGSRSQIAEGLTRQISGEKVSVTSAGIRPLKGLDKEAVEVMNEMGVDITKTKPELFTKDMVDDADVIVSVTGFPINNLLDMGDKQTHVWEIEDPAGEGVDMYRTVRDDIKTRIEELVGNLDG